MSAVSAVVYSLCQRYAGRVAIPVRSCAGLRTAVAVKTQCPAVRPDYCSTQLETKQESRVKCVAKVKI